MSHTKGPWFVDCNIPPNGMGVFVRVGANGRDLGIPISAQDDKGDRTADANLIAAAPDLLKVCKKALLLLENMTSGEYANGRDKAVRLHLAQAIAKAKGN